MQMQLAPQRQLALQKRLAPRVVVDHGHLVVAKAWPIGIGPVYVNVRPSACHSSSYSWHISSSKVRNCTIGIVVDSCCASVSACSDCRRNQDTLVRLVEV